MRIGEVLLSRAGLAKQRTNVPLDAGVLAEARALGLEVSAINAAALTEAIARQKDFEPAGAVSKTPIPRDPRR